MRRLLSAMVLGSARLAKRIECDPGRSGEGEMCPKQPESGGGPETLMVGQVEADNRSRAMKTLFIAISILFGASAVWAAEPSPVPGIEKLAQPPEQDDWLWECSALGKLAETIMTSRQEGISRATMIRAVQGKYLFEYMIIEAYDVPRYSTERMQKRSIEEFRDKIYLECVNATRRK